MADWHIPITMQEVTDPKELAQARAQDERFARNSAWLQRHAAEICTNYRGKCICVAGEELFIADAPEEALAQARAAHPERDIIGLFAVIVDRLDEVVYLLRQRQRYRIEQD